MVDRLPPFICRLIAREGRPPRLLTLHELAKRSGLPMARVAHLSRLKSWRNVPIEEVDAFRKGCGINSTNQWKHIFYLTRTFDANVVAQPLFHLSKLSYKRRKRLAKLVGALHQPLPQSPAPHSSASPPSASQRHPS